MEFWKDKWMDFRCQSMCFLFYFYFCMCVWWWRGELLPSSGKGVGSLATGVTGSCGSSDLGAGNQTPAHPVRFWERFHPIVPLWKVIKGLSFRHAIFLNLSSFLISGKKVEGSNTNNSPFVSWAFYVITIVCKYIISEKSSHSTPLTTWNQSSLGIPEFRILKPHSVKPHPDVSGLCLTFSLLRFPAASQDVTGLLGC